MNTTTETIAFPGPAPAKRGAGARAGRLIGIAAAGTALIVGILIAASAAGVIGVQAFSGKDGGFVSIEDERLAGGGYAIATDAIDLSGEIAGLGVEDLGATVRLDVEAAAGEARFVGIGRRDDVERYLRGVEHTTLLGLRDDRPRYAEHDGGRLAGRPGERPFWVASSQGTGNQAIEWEPRDGHWMAVVANADGGRGVDAEVEASARAPWLIWAGLGALVFGAMVAGLGGMAISRMRRGR